MKRKIYTTTDGNKIRKVGRQKKVYFAENPYFVWNGRRQHFDEIPRLSYPIMYTDDNEKTGVIGGYICLCNWGGVLVELDENSETVQLWEELERG